MRNHHRPLYQLYVCGAMVFETRDHLIAHEYARLSKKGPIDNMVYIKTIYRDTRKEEVRA